MGDVNNIKNKAELSFSRGKFSEALNLFKEIERVVGLHPELANDLAVVNFRLGNIQEAMDYFRRALVLQEANQQRISNNLMAVIEELVNLGGGLVSSTNPRHICPVCSQSNVLFNPLPDIYRQKAIEHGYLYYGKGEMTALSTYSCSSCGASDRERLYAYWIAQKMRAGELNQNMRVIHFAPEPTLSRLLRGYWFRYATADLYMDNVDYKVDLQSLPFESESFDFFICSHVLEHVENDDAAIRELTRITRKGGCGILMAPVIVGLEETLEDPTVTAPSERWKLYGQDDHVRLYAHDDYVRRLACHGFIVDQLGVEYFGEVVFAQLGLKPTSILYIVRRI